MITTGVIIAAGAGTRLSDKTKVPKPLRKVCGLPLIKRIILASAKAGLTKIVVVVGFEKEKIIDYLNSNQWPVEIQVVENQDWKKSNGISVLCVKKVVREDFILLMSDHVFDHRSLEILREKELGDCHVCLAVDYKTHQIFDQDDATKVEVESGKIKSIGKNLVDFNAIDTGMFAVSPKFFRALENAIKDGDCSLSDGMRDVASRGLADVFDIGDAYWQDVDTKPSLKHAEKVLLNACRKDTDGFVSRHFNRHISIFISSFLIKTPIQANPITFMIAIIGLFSGWFAAKGDYKHFLIGAILFKLTSILDGVDGEISKLRFTASKLGQWLDTLGDNLTYIVFVVGTVVGLYRRGNASIDYLGPIALVGLGMLILVMFAYLIRFTNSGSFLALQKEFLAKKNISFIKKIFIKISFMIKRDFFAALFLVFAIFDKPQWIVFVVALATNIAWVVIVQTKFFARK